MTAISASRLALFYSMPKGYCMVCPSLLLIIHFSQQSSSKNYPGICLHFYADDMQLYVHLTQKHITEAFDRMQNCLDYIKKVVFCKQA